MRRPQPIATSREMPFDSWIETIPLGLTLLLQPVETGGVPITQELGQGDNLFATTDLETNARTEWRIAHFKDVLVPMMPFYSQPVTEPYKKTEVPESAPRTEQAEDETAEHTVEAVGAAAIIEEAHRMEERHREEQQRRAEEQHREESRRSTEALEARRNEADQAISERTASGAEEAAIARLETAVAMAERDIGLVRAEQDLSPELAAVRQAQLGLMGLLHQGTGEQDMRAENVLRRAEIQIDLAERPDFGPVPEANAEYGGTTDNLQTTREVESEIVAEGLSEGDVALTGEPSEAKRIAETLPETATDILPEVPEHGPLTEGKTLGASETAPETGTVGERVPGASFQIANEPARTEIAAGAEIPSAAGALRENATGATVIEPARAETTTVETGPRAETAAAETPLATESRAEGIPEFESARAEVGGTREESSSAQVEARAGAVEPFGAEPTTEIAGEEARGIESEEVSRESATPQAATGERATPELATGQEPVTSPIGEQIEEKVKDEVRETITHPEPDMGEEQVRAEPSIPERTADGIRAEGSGVPREASRETIAGTEPSTPTDTHQISEPLEQASSRPELATGERATPELATGQEPATNPLGEQVEERVQDEVRGADTRPEPLAGEERGAAEPSPSERTEEIRADAGDASREVSGDTSRSIEKVNVPREQQSAQLEHASGERATPELATGQEPVRSPMGEQIEERVQDEARETLTDSGQTRQEAIPSAEHAAEPGQQIEPATAHETQPEGSTQGAEDQRNDTGLHGLHEVHEALHGGGHVKPKVSQAHSPVASASAVHATRPMQKPTRMRAGAIRKAGPTKTTASRAARQSAVKKAAVRAEGAAKPAVAPTRKAAARMPPARKPAPTTSNKLAEKIAAAVKGLRVPMAAVKAAGAAKLAKGPASRAPSRNKTAVASKRVNPGPQRRANARKEAEAPKLRRPRPDRPSEKIAPKPEPEPE